MKNLLTSPWLGLRPRTALSDDTSPVKPVTSLPPPTQTKPRLPTDLPSPKLFP